MSGARPPALDARTAALVRVAAAVARGKAPELEQRFAAARAARGPGLWIEELHSHLRGALNTGAAAEEIEGVLGLVDGDLDPELRRSAHEQWADVKKRKL